MKVIIYGKERPKIGFTQSPEGSITFSIENDTKIQFESEVDDITWLDMFRAEWKLYDKSESKQVEIFDQFIQEIANLTTTSSERKFFLGYVQECKVSSDEQNISIWNYPALIPQAWVNWIHYDPKDEDRAKRAQKEPFRVDFMLKDSDLCPDFVIFEIDGSSHFGSMEGYTEHLRKDRWLRKQGWKVIRVSNLEVDQYISFNLFFAELTGKYVSLPF
ncbi:MAG: DUF559 domain-containing protein [Ardenticatenaceae bacterium]|nr:DUF559 domain-containing protein [Ardenticatenaceae bacterium]MCB9445155.1 DUF559 domain-containing protein [Ardenticatenaceae bacterium]